MLSGYTSWAGAMGPSFISGQAWYALGYATTSATQTSGLACIAVEQPMTGDVPDRLSAASNGNSSDGTDGCRDSMIASGRGYEP